MATGITPDDFRAILGDRATAEEVKEATRSGRLYAGVANETNAGTGTGAEVGSDLPTGEPSTEGSMFPGLTSEQQTNMMTSDLTRGGAMEDYNLAQQNYMNMPTQSGFDQKIQEIMQNRAQQANAGLMKAGEKTAAELLLLPESLAAQEGWGGLTLDQARRMSAIEENGLTAMLDGISGALDNRRSRLKDLGDLAGQAYSDELTRASEIVNLKKEELERALELETTEFNKQLAIAQMQLSVPAGQTFEIDGKTYEGKAVVSAGGGGGGGGGGGTGADGFDPNRTAIYDDINYFINSGDYDGLANYLSTYSTAERDELRAGAAAHNDYIVRQGDLAELYDAPERAREQRELETAAAESSIFNTIGSWFD